MRILAMTAEMYFAGFGFDICDSGESEAMLAL
jgi:hypothetical protein